MSGATIYEFDAHTTNKMVYRWRGKLNLLPYPSTFHMSKVKANDFTNVIARFYMDGVLLYQRVVTSATEFRVPAVTGNNSVELELIGTSSIRTFQLAQNVSELD